MNKPGMHVNLLGSYIGTLKPVHFEFDKNDCMVQSTGACTPASLILFGGKPGIPIDYPYTVIATTKKHVYLCCLSTIAGRVVVFIIFIFAFCILWKKLF
jgi:hypothetical protein